MKKISWIWVLALGVVLATPTIAGDGYEKCTADTQTCLNMMVSNLKDRGWVGIEMEEEDGKLTILRVEDDSPAAESGLRQGDVLLAMNGIAFSEENHDRLYEAKKNMAVGKTVTYSVDRQGCCHIKGGKSEVEVTLANIPDEIIAKWVGQHMMDHAAIELAKN